MLKGIEFIREKSRGKVEEGRGRRFGVFHTSTLNVILRRYSLPEVPGRRIHNVIAHAMSICVAFGNKVMDTRLPQPIKRHEAPKYDMRCGVQCGRSMIEMLGVLAIIGVLSVSGIAGYSKAMEKWKINKIIGEYTMLMTGLMEYKDNFIKNMSEQSEPGIVDFVQAAHLVPETWQKKTDANMYDSLGNYMRIYFSNARNENGYDVGDRFVFDLHFANAKTSNNSFSYNLCLAFFRDMGKAMSYNMLSMGMIPVAQNTMYAGDSQCGGGLGYNGKTRKCLRDMTLSEMSEICKTCQTTNCGVVFVF